MRLLIDNKEICGGLQALLVSPVTPHGKESPAGRGRYTLSVTAPRALPQAPASGAMTLHTGERLYRVTDVRRVLRDAAGMEHHLLTADHCQDLTGRAPRGPDWSAPAESAPPPAPGGPWGAAVPVRPRAWKRRGA